MSRFATRTLVQRQLVVDRGAALLVVAVVFVVSALLAAWPRAIDHIFTEELRAQIEGLPHFARDLSGDVTVSAPPSSRGAEVTEDRLYGRFEATLHEIAGRVPQLVRPALGDPEYQLAGSVRELLGPAPPPLRFMYVTAVADPHYADRIRLVNGQLPSGVTVAGEVGSVERTVEIALAVNTAARLDWTVGEVRQFVPAADPLAPTEYARLTGIFEPVDAEAAYWAHHAGILDPREEYDPDRGILAYARGFVAPTAVPAVSEEAWTARVWYPLDGSRLLAGEAPELLSQLRAFSTQAYEVELGGGENIGAHPVLRLGSSTIDRLETTLTRQASATATMALIAAGPVGVVLAVVMLGSKLVLERRRRTVTLLTARGASPLQLRCLLAMEGALLGVPAAALATAAAAMLVPGRAGILGIALPAVVGLAPAIALPLVARPGAARTERADLGHRWRSRVRWSVEALAVAVAVAAAVSLNRRGLVAAGPASGIDPLLVATPMLVMLAAGVVVVRVYPVPVAMLHRLVRRRAGVVAFVGATRTVRDPAVGLAPVLALVIGLAVAVFSTVLWSTVQTGSTSHAVAQLGADLRAQALVISAEQVAEVATLPGVDAAVSVTQQGRADVTVGNRVERAHVYLTDTETLGKVQADLPGVAPIAEGLDRLRHGAVPVMVSDDVGGAGDVGTVDIGGGIPITVISVESQIAGLPANEPWVLIDRMAFAASGSWYERPARILLAAVDGAPGVVEAQVAGIVRTEGGVRTLDRVLGDVRGGPATAGIVASVLVALVVAGALSAVAVLLTQFIAAPARGRLLSQLRTLGISGRQAQGIATWETAPVVLVTLVAGAGLGLGVPWLVAGALDLRPLTGGRVQPAVMIDWALVFMAAGLFVLIVGITVAATVAFSRRLRLGVVLRVGEDS